MKKFILSILLCVCFIFCTCACVEDVTYSDEYYRLEETNAELESQIEYLEDELDYNNKSISYILNFFSTQSNASNIPVYKFGDIWSVGDFFDFSFTYDKEKDALCYKIKDKENDGIYWIGGDDNKIQNLFACFLRSDGTIETSESYLSDEDIALYLPEYNYEYEVYLFATVEGQVSAAKYKFFRDDIK